ncbi:hypothetical protein LCGC14_2935190, partial [marine sediment metagenome]
RKEEALRRARQIVKADPKNVKAAKVLAGVLGTLEKTEGYLRQLELLYEMDTADPGINNDLGYSWADQGRRLAKAERMIRIALRGRPGEVAFKDSLGWVLYKQGRFTKAKEVFDTVVDVDEDKLHPIILDHAGDNCWRLGLKLEAYRLWVRGVALAGRQERQDKETRQVGGHTAEKVAAGRKGRTPRLAPLGQAAGAPAAPRK